MNNNPRVFISGTFNDLSSHRRAAIDACLSLGTAPISMESISASIDTPEDTIANEIKNSDIFIGIIGFRYGYCLPGNNKSVTEFEYEIAIANGIPRLMFLINESQPVRISDVDMGETGERLRTFKKRLEEETIVVYFTTPEDLSEKVKESMRPLIASLYKDKSTPNQRPDQRSRFVAHPYPAQTIFINRQSELAQLNEWVSSKNTPIAIVHGVGGIGKTALAWKFFDECTLGVQTGLSNSFWWSFYEEFDFGSFLETVDNFLENIPNNTRIRKESRFSRVARIISTISKVNCLFVLDGIEMLLSTYETDYTQNKSTETQRLRRFESSDVTKFFRAILNSSLMRSKFLLTSRIIPLDLETPNGHLLPGCRGIALEALTTEAAVQLLKSYGITGSVEFLTNTAAAANNHPLATRLLAAQLTDSSIKQSTPDDLTQSMLGDAIDVALNRLDTNSLLVLKELSSEDKPLSYDDLIGKLLISSNLLKSPSKLDQVLTGLEDRGLINWDRLNNAYSIHPIVRIGVLSYLEQRENSIVARSDKNAQQVAPRDS